MIHPVILAGGSGSRLWPASRELYPKQFLNLSDSEHSLFQETVLRCLNVLSFSDPIIICNDEHRFLVAEQLRQINVTPQAILLEPEGKNTAPAITLSALFINNPEDWLLVMPADQKLESTTELLTLVDSHSINKSKGLITFGIETKNPNTGYGYIRKSEIPLHGDEYFVEEFIEKPDEETAKLLHSDVNVYWNSGMFLFKQSSLLNELKIYQKAIVDTCASALKLSKVDLDFIRIDKDTFTKCPNLSIDYALMEQTANATMLPFITPWSDVGVWSSLWEMSAKDKDNNHLIGDVIAIDTNECLIHSSSRLVATVGIKNHIIIETDDAVLVAEISHSQNVKQLVSLLKKENRSEAQHHKKVYRPWGWYESLSIGKRFQVKLISVNPGASLSLQKHLKRAEHWVVVKGEAIVTNGDEVKSYSVDESTYIPIGNQHRLENKGDIPLEIIEVQTGEYLGEDDIIRLEDIYGRTK